MLQFYNEAPPPTSLTPSPLTEVEIQDLLAALLPKIDLERWTASVEKIKVAGAT